MKVKYHKSTSTTEHARLSENTPLKTYRPTPTKPPLADSPPHAIKNTPKPGTLRLSNLYDNSVPG